MIEVVIDELVMRGLSPREARAAAAALEAKLAALAVAGGAEVSARAESFRRLAPVSADSPGALGESVAGAVWGAVAR